jgi:predicted Fe-Mo cluster-binding NifX family protein
MTIAVPTHGSAVDEHFGHTGSYTLFTVDDHRAVTSQETLQAPAGCGCKSNIIPTLSQKGVSLLLVGSIGGGAINKLNSYGIQVIRGCSGEAEAVVRQWLDGGTSDSGIICHHHDRACE